MSEILLFLQDVETIQIALEEAFDGLIISPETNKPLVAEVGHLKVDPDTIPPYVIIQDIISLPSYAFQRNIVSHDAMYAIRVITIDEDDFSAQTVASRINQIIYDTLHGKNLSIPSYPKPFKFRLGPKEPNRWEEVNSSTEYFHSGFKYLATDS